MENWKWFKCPTMDNWLNKLLIPYTIPYNGIMWTLFYLNALEGNLLTDYHFSKMITSAFAFLFYVFLCHPHFSMVDKFKIPKKNNFKEINGVITEAHVYIAKF